MCIWQFNTSILRLAYAKIRMTLGHSSSSCLCLSYSPLKIYIWKAAKEGASIHCFSTNATIADAEPGRSQELGTSFCISDRSPSTWAIIWCLPWCIRIRSGAAETQAGSTRWDVSRASGSWTCYAMMPIAQTFNHTFCYYFSTNILNYLLFFNEFSLLKDYYLYERQKVIVSNHWLIGQIPARQGLG